MMTKAERDWRDTAAGQNTKDSWQSPDARRQVWNKFPDPPRVNSHPYLLNHDNRFLLF